MPEEQKTAETEQERLADFPRDLSRSFTYLHRQRKKYNRHPGTTQDAIVSHMYIDKCTVARRTKRLEELGYISRETGKEDRRENNLYVTESAKSSCPSSARFCGIGPKASRATFPMKSAFYSSHC